ncbi:hypothetical protein VU07_03555 [Desulfobulbus sp. F4]|nr:hypothetical protein [Desulfobulbus sp. F3]MCW5200866.1 hypothetical protein [Desulfobulbus sp. F4]
MNKIIEFSRYISTPLILSGLIVAVFFGLMKLVIQKSPEWAKKDSSKIIILIIHWTGILSLIAIFLGFSGYAYREINNKDYEKTNYISKNGGESEQQNRIAPHPSDKILNDNISVELSDIDPVITEKGVDPFLIGEDIDKIEYHYPILIEKKNEVRHTDDGTEERLIYTVSNKSEILLHIIPLIDEKNDNPTSIIDEIHIFSNKFATKNNIRVGSTISNLFNKYQNLKIWYSMIGEEFAAETDLLFNIQFYVDRKAYISPIDKLGNGEFDSLSFNDFSNDGKVELIRVWNRSK